ncbi:MAG: hypothetical protein WD824_00010 [Cyclobacteriaceae bacterium]
MKSRVFLVISIFFVSFCAVGQADSLDSKPSYFLSIYSGGLLGKKGKGSAMTVSLIQGVRHKRFAFGAGIGYDAYTEWRTFPIFGSVAFDLSKGRNRWFIQFNAGYSKAWNPTRPEAALRYDDKGGSIFHPLLGYRIQNGNMVLYLTAGYRFQRLTSEWTERFWGWGNSPNKFTERRDIERLSVQIGFGLR